jgi:hypothetical protein
VLVLQAHAGFWFGCSAVLVLGFCLPWEGFDFGFCGAGAAAGLPVPVGRRAGQRLCLGLEALRWRLGGWEGGVRFAGVNPKIETVS